MKYNHPNDAFGGTGQEFPNSTDVQGHFYTPGYQPGPGEASGYQTATGMGIPDSPLNPPHGGSAVIYPYSQKMNPKF